MKGARSLREMTRLLDVDQRYRRLCLLKTGEAAYSRSVLSRFTRKIGEDNLVRIIEEKVVRLLKQNENGAYSFSVDCSASVFDKTRAPPITPRSSPTR